MSAEIKKEIALEIAHVLSRILWEQMLGRGTRFCADINKGVAK
jgi:type I site-specific restriction endonuclease